MKLFCVINIFMLQVVLATLVKFYEYSHVMESAIRSLTHKSPQNEVKFLIASKIFQLNHVLMNSCEDKAVITNVMNSTNLSRRNLVIIVIDSVINSEEFLLSATHNVDEFFIIMSYDFNQSLVIKLFQKIWDMKKITDINFMFPQNKNNEIILVTFYPFADENCGNIKRLNVINKFMASNWNSNNFFPIKLRNFHGCMLRLGTQPSFPAADKIIHGNGSYGFIGSDIEITNALSRKYNFTNKFIHNDWWGSVFENGSGDGTIGRLITKDVDYICGWHFMNMLKSTFLDNSQPYFFVPFVIVVPPGKLILILNVMLFDLI